MFLTLKIIDMVIYHLANNDVVAHVSVTLIMLTFFSSRVAYEAPTWHNVFLIYINGNKTEICLYFSVCRKIRHKNVVQFIGASTEPSNLCIVTGKAWMHFKIASNPTKECNWIYVFCICGSEFMSGGSVYDYLHKQKGTFKLPVLLKVAIDISRGMNYLHQNSIIHRDLKAANLLMDENDVRCSITFNFRSYKKLV